MMKFKLLTAICLAFFTPTLALGGNFDRDVSRAIENIRKDQLKGKDPDREYSEYRRLLENYRSKREQILENLLSELRNNDPNYNITSNWNSRTRELWEGFKVLKLDIAGVFRDFNNENADYASERIGIKDFMKDEDEFVTALMEKPIFPETRFDVLTLMKRTRDALQELDRKTEELLRRDDEIDAKRDEAGQKALDKLKEIGKTLRDIAAAGDLPPNLLPDEIQPIALGLKEYDNLTIFFLKQFNSEEAEVWASFGRAREDALKIINLARIDLVKELIRKAEDASRNNSALSNSNNRWDYKLFHEEAIKILSSQSTELYDRIKDRFVDTVNSDLAERFTEESRVRELLEKIQLESKTLEELITEYEYKASNSPRPSQEKRFFRQARNLILNAKLYDAWRRGYEEHIQAAKNSGLKR